MGGREDIRHHDVLQAKRNDAEAAIVSDARAGLTAIKVPLWSGQITQRSETLLALGAGAGIGRSSIPICRRGRDDAALGRDRKVGEGDQRRRWLEPGAGSFEAMGSRVISLRVCLGSAVPWRPLLG